MDREDVRVVIQMTDCCHQACVCGTAAGVARERKTQREGEEGEASSW